MEDNRQKPGFFVRLATLIVDKRNLFFLLYTAGIIFSLISQGWVQVNNDITDYLPEETETRRGLTVMNDNFITYGSARVMITNVTQERAQALADQVADLDGVSRVTFDSSEDHYRGTAALLDVSFDGTETDQVSIDAMEKINELLEQVKTEQVRLRRAEFELLQSQINPHFLYNTLDAIVWLAEAGEQKKVVSMVGSLSDFFRISLNQGQDILDVREELQHVRSYLEIQQMRYQDILQYEICVPEELYSSRIPKITLQPLVENALYHGIKNKRGKGMIRIDGEMEDSDCILRITDNGRGMTPERLGQVREGIRNRNACETEIYGLYNVNERIRLNFGEKYGITITSTYGEGTCVTVRLPEYTL